MKRRKQVTEEVIEETPSRLDILKRIAGESKDVPIASLRLKEVRYVPTIFTSFNRATVVGGAPIRATWLIHGPPAGGKTALAVGILRSFQKYGHFAGYVDAEHACDKQWFTHMGLDLDDLLFCQPDSFEDAVQTIDKWVTNFSQMKEEKVIEEDVCFALAIDTIHKLTPKKELILTLKNDKEMNKGWGRYRSNLISVWIDRMTPIVGKNDIALLLLAHEHELPGDGTSLYNDYRVKGGQSLVFEAMVRARVREEKLWQEQGGKKRIVGKAHHVLVEKNKVGYPFERSVFFTSTGKGQAPIGFDLAKEIFTEALARGLIEQGGSWYEITCTGDRAQGEANLVELIRNNQETYDNLYRELNDDLERRKEKTD